MKSGRVVSNEVKKETGERESERQKGTKQQRNFTIRLNLGSPLPGQPPLLRPASTTQTPMLHMLRDLNSPEVLCPGTAVGLPGFKSQHCPHPTCVTLDKRLSFSVPPVSYSVKGG